MKTRPDGQREGRMEGRQECRRLRLLCVAGARPNFVKIAPLLRAFRRCSSFEVKLVHTGQHSGAALSDTFFEDLAIPRADVQLGVHAGLARDQAAEIRRRFEPVLADYRPHAVVVVGDVTSTLACAEVAAATRLSFEFATRLGRRQGPLLVHVEAGLRSFDETMPEELNRRRTDALSDLLYVSEPAGVENLRREGIAGERVVLVGNVMIDSLLVEQAKTPTTDVRRQLGLPASYGVVTLHRPANVDDPLRLEAVLRILDRLSAHLPLVFPVHPRTHASLRALPLELLPPRWTLLAPQRYPDFTRLLASARVVLTDSGGVQEETTFLRIPCLTLRSTTERPITVTHGTNILVGVDPRALALAFERVLANPPEGTIPELWDGRAAERIAAHLSHVLAPALAELATARTPDNVLITQEREGLRA